MREAEKEGRGDSKRSRKWRKEEAPVQKKKKRVAERASEKRRKKDGAGVEVVK